MDISAILTPGAAAPEAGATGATAAPTPAPGDAFASVFATAMGDAVPPDPATVDRSDGTPDPVLPPVCPVAAEDPLLPPTCPGPPVDAPPGAPAAKADPIHPRTKIEPPPPRPAKGLASEKEAPTIAPNAPVEPLDQDSEDQARDGESLSSADAADPIILVLPRPDSPLVPAGTPDVPRILVLPIESAPLVPSDAPDVPLILVLPKSGAPRAASSIPMGPTLVGGEDVANALASTARQDAAPLSRNPTASRLESAPDLGLVPTVVPAPVAEAAPVPTPARNAAVAKVAVASIAPAGAVASPKAVETADVKAVVALVEATPADAGDTPDDDAPKDATPETLVAVPATKTLATERPEPGSDRPSVDRHLVVRQVADRIENLAAARPKDGVTIHLEPRDLGTITLVVKGLQSALDVQVTASDDRVRQSLDASRPELAQALAPRGIELRELRVAVAPTNGTPVGANPNPNPGSNPDPRPRHQAPSMAFARTSRNDSPAPRPGRTSGRGVDLFV